MFLDNCQPVYMSYTLNGIRPVQLNRHHVYNVTPYISMAFPAKLLSKYFTYKMQKDGRHADTNFYLPMIRSKQLFSQNNKTHITLHLPKHEGFGWPMSQ